MRTLSKTSYLYRPVFGKWAAFGASSLAGLAAGELWAPAAGKYARRWLTTSLRGWFWAWGSTRSAAGYCPRRPDRLLTER